MIKKGFTLIELMIVIAIISILVEAFWAPGRIFIGLQENYQKVLEKNRAISAEYLVLKAFNQRRVRVYEASPFRVIFEDGSELILDSDYNQIHLIESGKKKTLRQIAFKSAIKAVDYRTYSFDISINGEELKSFWRCGGGE